MNTERISNTKSQTEEPANMQERKGSIPLWEKCTLTLEEAVIYSGIGRDKLRYISNREDCSFVLWNGTKRLIKRKKLDEYIDNAFSI